MSQLYNFIILLPVVVAFNILFYFFDLHGALAALIACLTIPLTSYFIHPTKTEASSKSASHKIKVVDLDSVEGEVDDRNEVPSIIPPNKQEEENDANIDNRTVVIWTLTITFCISFVLYNFLADQKAYTSISEPKNTDSYKRSDPIPESTTISIEDIDTQALIGKTSIPFNQEVMDAVMQIQIRNKYGELIGWGTGMSFSSLEVLTNYHVIEEVIANPSWYTIYGCLTSNLEVEPDCTLQLSLTQNAWGFNNSPIHKQEWDLALLYIDKVKINSTWQALTDINLNKLIHRPIDFADYINSINDIKINSTVYAIGYPDYGNGTAVQVQGKVLDYIWDGQQLVVSDYPISFGNSGGPVLNSVGKLVGVTMACYVDESERCVTGLFIPLSTVHYWLNEELGMEWLKWAGKTSYWPKGTTVSDIGNVLCLLRYEAYYNPTKLIDNCSCKDGFAASILGGDCDLVVFDKNKVKDSIRSQISSDTEQAPLCQQQYGAYSVYSSLYASFGQDPCLCVAGYKMDNIKSACIRVTEAENLSLRDNPDSDYYLDVDAKCIESHGPGGMYNSVLPTVGICACRDGYILTTDRKYCSVQ